MDQKEAPLKHEYLWASSLDMVFSFHYYPIPAKHTKFGTTNFEMRKAFC